LIKEKFKLQPIQQIVVFFWGYVMTIGIVPFISTWLILAVSICWFVGGQTSIFGHHSIQQGDNQKQIYSPAQIRPPPLAA
jgi:hypothetical protein